jgi:hypothetical protein
MLLTAQFLLGFAKLLLKKSIVNFIKEIAINTHALEKHDALLIKKKC